MLDDAGDSLPATLRRLRIAAGLTQEAIAERSGISARTVSDIERGLRTTIYPDTARRLAAALGLRDEARNRFEGVVRRRDAGGESESHPRVSLPVVPTTFLGRSSELSAVTASIAAAGVRLLVLTGPGGVGKTRLAIEAARRLEQSFALGIFFIPLGDLREPGLVASAIAKNLGVVERGERLEVLIEERLRGGRSLIVLDTFEHVLDAAVFVSALLGACAQATFLVTSRSPLRLRGEFEFPVSPLEMPSDLGEDALQQLQRSPATALFLERAAAAKPDLMLDPRAPTLVMQICHQLDGLPLAIELAAARVQHLPLAALAEQLSRRLHVLTGGARDLPARQRTMRETVAWSHDLLTPAAAALFRRLAVFSGGCSLASVDPVCGPVGGDALDIMSVLVDHSLVSVSESVDARYEMLDIIQEYAGERLAASGEAEAVARRHALRMLEIAELAEPHMVRGTSGDWLKRLEAERGNLRRAIAWSIEIGDNTVALRFTVALWRYWRHTGEFTEGRRWSEATLAMPGEAPAALRAKALWGTAFLAYPQGDYERMAELAVEDLSVARQSAEVMDLRNALTIVGQVAMCQGRFADALAPFRESLAICSLLDLSWQLGTSHLNLGNAMLHCGDLAAAEETFARGLAVYRELGDETFAARISIALAQAALVRGDIERADTLARSSLTAFVTQRERIGVAEALDTLAAIAARQGHLERAATLDGAATRIHETISFRPAPFERAITGRLIEVARSDLGPDRWSTAWAEGHALSQADAVEGALV